MERNMTKTFCPDCVVAALLISVAAGFPGAQPRCAAEPAKPMTIVTFGDSTTALRGRLKIYSKLLREELPAKGVNAVVINAGVGGNDTNRARRRFDKDVLGRDPDLVVIQFGINDSAIDVWRKPPATAPRVAREQYEKNLRHFISKLKERGATVVLMTPNPLCWTPKLKEIYGKPPYDPDDPAGFNLALKDYAESVRRIAGEEKVTLVDVDGAFRAHAAAEGQSLGDLLLDGMHPNNKGQRIVADLLLAKIPGLTVAQPSTDAPPKAEPAQ